MRVVGIHTFMATTLLMLDSIALKLVRRTPPPWSAVTFSRKYGIKRTGGGGIVIQYCCSSSPLCCGFKSSHMNNMQKFARKIHGRLPFKQSRSVCQMKDIRGGNSMGGLVVSENMEETTTKKSKPYMEYNATSQEKMMHLGRLNTKNNEVEAVITSKEVEEKESMMESRKGRWIMTASGIQLDENKHLGHGQSNEGNSEMKARIQAALQNQDDKICETAGATVHGFDPDVDLKLDQQQLKFQVSVEDGVCPGCGVTFQCIDSSGPGYLPTKEVEMAKDQTSSIIKEHQDEHHSTNESSNEDVVVKEEETTTPICQRCYKLTHYGQMNENLRPGLSTHDLLTPLHFQELLKPLRKMRCVIVYIVDLFDFHGSFLYSIPRIVGDNPVLVIANKIDLFPKDIKFSRVQHWIKQECRNRGLHDITAGQVHLVSCKTGFGVSEVLRRAYQSAEDRGCDIYVIGAANAGKSTFINHLLKVSVVPGTTLNFLKIRLGSKISLYDTPGLFLSHQITSHLNEKELKAVIPRRRVDHVTLRVSEGKAVLIGGLACVELVQGRPFLLTFFISNDVKLHATSAKKANEILSNCNCDLVFPPFEPERQKMLRPFSEDVFTIHGSGWKKSCKDIVLSGLGWVSVTGAGDCCIKVYSPSEMHVMLREPLVPFEARETTSIFTGGKVLKRGPKKKRYGHRV